MFLPAVDSTRLAEQVNVSEAPTPRDTEEVYDNSSEEMILKLDSYKTFLKTLF